MPVAAPALPVIVAHRGYSAAHRENSPAAWRAAVTARADVIEADIRMTRDGTLVCCHDGDLHRLGGREERIADLDAEALAAVAIGGEAAAPTLATLLATLPPAQPILFDVKDERPEVLDRLVAAADASARRGLIFGLHTLDTVRYVRARSTAAILGLLAAPADEDAFFAAGGDILRLWESDATAALIGAITGRGHPVWITTGHHGTTRDVGDFDADVLRRMAAAGATGFLVNDPVAAREALYASRSEPVA
jgi:glycerophosphoryl diester phosphodiesterase